MCASSDLKADFEFISNRTGDVGGQDLSGCLVEVPKLDLQPFDIPIERKQEVVNGILPSVNHQSVGVYGIMNGQGELTVMDGCQVQHWPGTVVFIHRFRQIGGGFKARSVSETERDEVDGKHRCVDNHQPTEGRLGIRIHRPRLTGAQFTLGSLNPYSCHELVKSERHVLEKSIHVEALNVAPLKENGSTSVANNLRPEDEVGVDERCLSLSRMNHDVCGPQCLG